MRESVWVAAVRGRSPAAGDRSDGGAKGLREASEERRLKELPEA